MDRLNSHLIITLLLAASTTTASAATTAVWTGFSDSIAFGTLDGVSIAAISDGSAPFVGIVDGRFTAEDNGGWDAPFPLLPETDSLVAANVNGGDSQEFHFANPIREGLLYIENFDSSSIADITVVGGETLQLVASSPSISFAELSANKGTLKTDNPTYNGEGDAILLFAGAVSEIKIWYEQGDGANGVFYGFAMEDVQSVPEPTGRTLAVLLALVPLFFRHSRQAVSLN